MRYRNLSAGRSSHHRCRQQKRRRPHHAQGLPKETALRSSPRRTCRVPAHKSQKNISCFSYSNTQKLCLKRSLPTPESSRISDVRSSRSSVPSASADPPPALDPDWWHPTVRAPSENSRSVPLILSTPRCLHQSSLNFPLRSLTLGLAGDVSPTARLPEVKVEGLSLLRLRLCRLPPSDILAPSWNGVSTGQTALSARPDASLPAPL